MRVQFNSGTWTDEEHQGFLRGLEVYGRGNWETIGVFVPTRSPLQIEEHARQHYAGVETVHQEEVQVARGGETHPSSSAAAPSSSSPPSLNDGGGSGGDAGGHGGNDSEPPIVPHLVDGVPATHQQEDLYTNNGIDVATGGTPSTDAVPGGQGTPEQQHHHHHHHEHQPGEPIGNLMTHEIPYPNSLVWEEPTLGEQFFGVTDFCGVL